MDVTATTAAAATSTNSVNTASTPNSGEKTRLDYNSFLTLLIAQLKNQDPTEPKDSAEYIAQLASFSNVEQSIKTNAKLDDMMTAFALSQADGVIGKTLTSPDGGVSGTVSSLRVISGGAVAVLEDGSEVPLGAGVVIS